MIMAHCHLQSMMQTQRKDKKRRVSSWSPSLLLASLLLASLLSRNLQVWKLWTLSCEICSEPNEDPRYETEEDVCAQTGLWEAGLPAAWLLTEPLTSAKFQQSVFFSNEHLLDYFGQD